jgi:hypothetical protein
VNRPTKMTDADYERLTAFDEGSFRDPLSRVVHAQDRVLRVLRDDGVADFETLESSAFWTDAQADGSVVATGRTEVPNALAESGWEAALEHERIPVISYPYEWTFSMLQDAALQQLRLTRMALAGRLLTKDATPFNSQFVGAAPVFVDVGSFERLRPNEPWRGYRQFCELFYNPLLLQAVANMPFQPWLRGSLRGISPEVTRSLLPTRRRVGRGAFVNVVLHSRLERKYSNNSRDVTGEIRRAGFNPKLIESQLAKLEKVVGGLDWAEASSTWSEYTDRSHYGERDLEAKASFVREVTSAVPRSQVLDLGANDGYFSRIASEHAEYVVAVDSDALVIDRLYRSLRAEGNRSVLPLYSDLVDPSPSLGWRSQERPALTSRVSPDLVLALALVHHLAITDTVPLAEVVAMLRDYDCEVVVEFPTREDPMVRRLLQRKRSGLFDHYSLESFEDALTSRFDIVRREHLPSETRHLFHVRPR